MVKICSYRFSKGYWLTRTNSPKWLAREEFWVKGRAGSPSGWLVWAALYEHLGSRSWNG